MLILKILVHVESVLWYIHTLHHTISSSPSHSLPPPPPLSSFSPSLTRLVPIEELSAGQISVLQKLSLVKLTAMLELYGSSVNM